MFKSSAITMVSSRKQGVVRENSLYSFLMDHKALDMLSDYHTHHGRGERQVIYVDFPLDGAEDITLVDGFKLMGQHLSVDKLVIHKESWLSHMFSPGHATLVCNNIEASEQLVVHVYFNRHGHITELQAKVYALTHGVRTDEGRVRVISDREKGLMYRHARPIHELYNKLLNQKATTFIALYEESFTLDDALSNAVMSQNTREVIKKADALMALTLKLTDYSDITQDGRVTYLKDMLQQIQEGAFFRKESALTSSTTAMENDTNTQIPERAASVGKQTPHSKSVKKTEAMREIVNFVDTIVSFCEQNPEQSLSQQLVIMNNELDQLERCILALELSSPRSVSTFIHQQRARLPIKTSLNDYFQARILAGDLQSVVALYPIVVQRANMRQILANMILAIEGESDSTLCEQLINVADFFNEESELYRSLIITYNYVIRYDPVAQLGFGFLHSFLKKNNLPGFSMALRHGVSWDSTQMIHGTTMHNALQMLILCYATNPNVLFVRQLMEHGAQMTFERSHTVATRQVFGKGFFNTIPEFRNGSKLLKDDSQSSASVLLNRVSKLDNALMLASELWAGVYPEIIGELARHASVEHLLLSISNLCDKTIFCTRFIPFKPPSDTRVFINKASCDDATQAAYQSEPPHKTCCFLYYYSPQKAMSECESNLVTTVNALLTKATDVFSMVSVDTDNRLTEQRRIIKYLTACGTKHKDSGEHHKAFHCYRAAQLAYTMIRDPQLMDHQMMAQLLAFVAAIVKKLDIKYQQVNYTDAHNFIGFIHRTLPASELACFQKMPIYQFLWDKTESYRTHPESLHTTLPSLSLSK